MAEYCEAAISKGIRVMGIANHLDPGLPHADSYDHLKLLAELNEARDRYKDRLTILAGIEVTYQSDIEALILNALEKIEVDFIIGSVHLVGGAEFTITEEEGARNYFREKHTAQEAYEPYFEEVLRAVKSGFFDVLGHIDVIRRYGAMAPEPLRAEDYYGLLRRTIEGLIKRDMALEVNSSGLFHHTAEIYPSADILRLYRELGGKRISLGSDAHRPAEIGRGFDEAIKLIKSNGFKAITYFERRLSREMPLT